MDNKESLLEKLKQFNGGTLLQLNGYGGQRILLPYSNDGGTLTSYDIRKNGYITIQEVKRLVNEELQNIFAAQMCIEYITTYTEKYKLGWGKGVRYYYNKYEVRGVIKAFLTDDFSEIGNGIRDGQYRKQMYKISK